MTVVVDEAPYEAGFDPYNKLIDRVSADNRQARLALTGSPGRPRRAARRPYLNGPAAISAGGWGGFRVQFAPFSARLPPRKGYVSQVARRIALSRDSISDSPIGFYPARLS